MLTENSKLEARSKSEIQMHQRSKQRRTSLFLGSFGHLDFGNLNLFRISTFGFRIYFPTVVSVSSVVNLLCCLA